MQVVSVNVGMPRDVTWRGKPVRTGIFKTPVQGPVRTGEANLAGDGQADLESHGGELKSVYGYPSEHYPYWREAFPEAPHGWGLLGENLTTRGLLESELRIGDRLRFGSAELEVTQPRMPCFKLGLRFGDPAVVKSFRNGDRPGFYLRIVSPGEIATGSTIEPLASEPTRPTLVEIVRLARGETASRGALEAALALPTLGPEWRDAFRRQLE
ncbi:MAG: MOSC domain-containing protein [Myxococcales bacterium]|nr:MOSC domain-containing protein [Myxococcales bacterium]